jgi:hypothetical protein
MQFPDTWSVTSITSDKVVSSINITMSSWSEPPFCSSFGVSTTLASWLIFIMKARGPNLLPCGIPPLILLHSDLWWSCEIQDGGPRVCPFDRARRYLGWHQREKQDPWQEQSMDRRKKVVGSKRIGRIAEQSTFEGPANIAEPGHRRPNFWTSYIFWIFSRYNILK